MRVALHLGILLLLLWGCQDPTTPPNDECDLCLPLAYPDENFYYTLNGRKIPLTISSEKISLKFDNSATPQQIQALFIAEPALGDTTPLPGVSARGFYAVQITEVTDVKALVKRLDDRPEIAIVNPVFFVEDSLEIILYDRFVVKFKPSVSRAEIDTVNKCNHVEIVGVSGVENNRYTFKITTESDLSVLKMSNLYYECLPADYSVPGFFGKVELHYTPNDPYFEEQYYFHNTGQTGGVSDADINAPSAWNISKGSSNIIVAVLDAGVAANEDLPAGIIAATHNSIDAAGLAPNEKIIPLRLINYRGGSDPYPPGNYTTTFGGTSAACPQVAGIAAFPLILGQLWHACTNAVLTNFFW